MKNILVIALCVALIGFAGYNVVQNQNKAATSVDQPSLQPQNNSTTGTTTQDTTDIPAVSIVAENLDTPWALAFLPASQAGGPDESLLITERAGTVRLVDSQGTLQPTPVATLSTVEEIGEGGLLGITIHPQFSTNKYVYLYYTYDSANENTLNRVVRMTFQNNTLQNEEIIVDKIPGASNHNGGRIRFGPDGFLYIGTGDAQEPSQAQNTSTLGGKILRVTDDGKPAPGNVLNNAAYSYGHRNVQGLAWNSAGDLWATEHGRSGIQSGLDELNLVENGKNYGWPEIEGDEKRAGMEISERNSGSTTWAPSGADFVGDRLFFSGLRGQTLYEAVISGNTVAEVKEHFNGEYGRIREVITGPDGMLYITTSNKDGRGIPKNGDDKVLRINPNKLRT